MHEERKDLGLACLLTQDEWRLALGLVDLPFFDSFLCVLRTRPKTPFSALELWYQSLVKFVNSSIICTFYNLLINIPMEPK